MKGFNSKFTSFPDYILGITHEIWEEKQVETLHHYYSEDIVVRSPSSVVIGNKAVIDATYATLDEFPDRQLLGEDVIWSGNPDAGMLSSHRILSKATHLKDGIYGKASGKMLKYRVIADCHAINNQINDEWLVRDQGAIIQQLGWNVSNYARQLITDEGGAENCDQPYSDAIEVAGPYQGTGNVNQWGEVLADILRQLVNGNISAIRSQYDRAATGYYPLFQTATGYEEIEAFWQAFIASLRDISFTIHHQIGMEEPMMSPRAAIRWSLSAIHGGTGRFGAPSGAPIYVMGITHAEFGPWGLRREYTLFDDVAIWKQIHLGNRSIS